MSQIHPRDGFIPGQLVDDANGTYTITFLLNNQQVIVKNSKGKLLAKELSSLTIHGLVVDERPVKDLEKIAADKWNEAIRRKQMLDPISMKRKRSKDTATVDAIARELGVSRPSIYRWLKRYETFGSATSLLRKKRSDSGSSKLPEEINAIIQEGIEKYYLSAERRSVASTFKKICIDCELLKLKPPSLTAVKARIEKIDTFREAQRRFGTKYARSKYKPISGSFPNVNYPLAVVQIDHTLADIILVEDETRKPLGRPTLSVAIDLFSRMVTGYYLSLDAPSSLSSLQCIYHSIISKKPLLEKYGLAEQFSWPSQGLMTTIHSDNGKDFRSESFVRTTTQYGITLEKRPLQQPQFGGHIERAFRTFMQSIHDNLPGKTFSNTVKKLYYDAEKRACLTYDEFEQWFVLYLVSSYSLTTHSAIKMAPIDKWHEGIQGGNSLGLPRVPMMPPDLEQLKIDFLPSFTRTIQRHGISHQNVSYNHPALSLLIEKNRSETKKAKTEYLFRYDPRDISIIWMFLEKKNEYLAIPNTGESLEGMSLEELKATKRILRSKGIKSPHSHLIAVGNKKGEDLVKESIERSIKSRKASQKKKVNKNKVADLGLTKTHSPLPQAKPTTNINKPIDDEDDDDYSNLTPFRAE